MCVCVCACACVCACVSVCVCGHCQEIKDMFDLRQASRCLEDYKQGKDSSKPKKKLVKRFKCPFT